LPPSSYALTPRRRKKIREALKRYPLDTIKAAIRGVKRSDFHMGRNDRGKRYTMIETILRDERTIETHAEAELVANEELCPLTPYRGESTQEFEDRKRQWAREQR
jgi:hypothetical protein